MAYCSARPPELTHFLTIHFLPHFPTRASSPNSIFTLLILCSSSQLSSSLPQKKNPRFCPPTHLFFRPSLLRISPGPPPFTPLLRLLLPSSRYLKFLSSLPHCHSPPLITTHYYHQPPLPIPPAAHRFTFLWILPSSWAVCCHYLEPLLEKRCNLCLAGPRIGCFLRFLRCLCFAKPR